MQEPFSTKDIDLLQSKGISKETVLEQISYFKQGFPYLNIKYVATLERGITTISPSDLEKYISDWDQYTNSDKSIVKFVPASGAASRMFKELFEFLDTISDLPESDFLKTFFIHIKDFAFYKDLNEICKKNESKGIDELTGNNLYKSVVRNLLSTEGLNYGNLPKGLLKFHRYPNGERTAFEEHLVEGTLYAKSRKNEVKLHFTVSTEHRIIFEILIKEILQKYSTELDTTFNISFSEQKPSTDTIAVDSDNGPFRDNGVLLFRPGGHGALIENLNDIDADVVFIKNIDNVVPDKLKLDESKYKKALAGYLIHTQKRIFEYLLLIDSGNYNREQLLEILRFLQNELNIKNPEVKYLEDVELVLYLKGKLNRPIRVCGMVKNIGEPGGGPFYAVNQDGTISLQILESSQIDMNDPETREMFNSGTHFNPVDLVCSLKDYQNNKFDLKSFIDKNTGFISKKSKSGKELKALELPGLWNGAMSDWNTIFVEVPLSTFNPVKNVNDLLRIEHQNI